MARWILLREELGRCGTRKFEGNRLEFRCSTVPGKHGEKMVLRILNSDASALKLDTLIHIESVKDFRKITNATNGIVIVLPTGSGKSTTLAAALEKKTMEILI